MWGTIWAERVQVEPLTRKKLGSAPGTMVFSHYTIVGSATRGNGLVGFTLSRVGRGVRRLPFWDEHDACLQEGVREGSDQRGLNHKAVSK